MSCLTRLILKEQSHVGLGRLSQLQFSAFDFLRCYQLERRFNTFVSCITHSNNIILFFKVLEDPEPAVRREVCSAIYRLCLGTSASVDPMETSLVAPMLSQLLMYLDKAEGMRPQKIEVSNTIQIFMFTNNQYFYLYLTLTALLLNRQSGISCMFKKM